jgi:hypothetical protein
VRKGAATGNLGGGGRGGEGLYGFGHEPFYLSVEPKGGWTMTDLVGLVFVIFFFFIRMSSQREGGQ